MNSPNQEQSDLSVQTINSKGEAPKRRMSTPAAAWSAYTNLWYQGRKRDARFGDIAGIYAGYPPTPPQVLANNGIPDAPNINTKQFQAKVDKYASTWNAVSSQNDGWFKVKMRHPDPMEAMRRSECATKHFNAAIKTWDDSAAEEDDFCTLSAYVINSQVRDKQMGLFSIGVGLWEDPIDFRWVPIPTRRVFVPQGTRLSLVNCPAIFIEDNNFSVAQLWNMRGKPGWNNDAIERCLYDRVELQAQTQQRAWSYSEWINYIRNNDVPYPYDFAPIRLVHAFTQEFDLTISHSIFCDFTYTGGSGKDFKRSQRSKEYQNAAQQFLYDKANVAKRWQQVVSVFADNAGPEGDWHGVKGFGDLIYDGAHLNNLMFNRGATGAFINNTLMFKGATQADVDKMDQIVLTHMGIMAPGLELEQQKFAGDIEGAMSMFNAGTAILDQNARDFPQNQRTAGGDQPTATQVNYDRADEAQMDSLQVQNYHTFADALGAEMYRRIAQPASKYPESWGGGKVAKKFRELCAADGIPEADLLKVESVKANRTGGTGNVGLDNAKADQALMVATPGMGQLNARKAKVAAWWGHENVGAFIEDAPQAVPDDQQIDTENLLIQEGQVPTPFGWQDQQKHVESHLSLGAQASQAAQAIIEQGTVAQDTEGAQKLSNLILSCAEHVSRHIQLMAQIPRIGKKDTIYTAIIQEAQKQAHNLMQIGQALAEDVAKAAQAQQPQMSPEMMKAQNQITIDNAKAQAEIERKNREHLAKMGNLAMQNQARTEMKLAQNDLNLATKAQQTREDLHLNAAKTIQELMQRHATHAQDMHEQRQNHQMQMSQEEAAATAE